MNAQDAPLGWTRRCVAVDRRNDGIVAVRAERTRGRIAVSPIDPRKTLRDSGDGRTVHTVACLTPRRCVTRRLEAPLRSAAKARRVLPSLLDIQLPFTLEECVYDFLDITPGPASTRTLAVAARRRDIAAELEQWNADGFDPMVFDHEGLALWTQSLREDASAPEDAGSWRLVVNLRDAGAVVALGTGARFISAHTLKSDNARQVHRLVRGAMDATDREGEDREPDGGETSVHVAWCGAGVEDEQRLSTFQKQLGKLWNTQHTVHKDPATFLPRAMAVRALQAGPLRCNLRRDDLTHPAFISRGQRRTLAVALLIAAAGTIMIATHTVLLHRMRGAASAASAAVAARIDALAGFNVAAKGPDALRIVEDRVRKRKQALEPFVRHLEPTVSRSLADIMQAGRDDALQVEVLSVTPGKLAISGLAKGPDAWQTLEAVVRRMEYRGTVEPAPERADGNIPFALQARKEAGR